ncbi:MAG: MBL fold metallo-hydrolase [Planctomycetes bacterium]|nr:MBL fold metallo-hydrolase [Planctomycetota bacterium]
MASITKRRRENVEGNFYVDDTCIDCDTCRWMAPETFHEDHDMSAVHHQPRTREEALSAAEALVACPTASIGVREKIPEIAEASASFPKLIADNVYHCGYHSEDSFGAASYLIVRESGNVLIDSPRFAGRLVTNIEKLGGVRTMLLTHKDDVADHAKYANKFGCERVMHAGDGARARGMERVIDGEDAIELDDELKIIPVPGHTRGSMVFLYKDEFLFTGDHLAFSRRLGHLYAFRGACWYSWTEVKRSVRKLADYRFRYVLPGHGAPFRGSFEEAEKQLGFCIEWMERNS